MSQQRKRLTDRVRAIGPSIKANPKKYAGGTAAALVAVALGLQATGTVNTLEFAADILNISVVTDNSQNIDNSENITEVVNKGSVYFVTYADGTVREFDSIDAVQEEHPEWQSNPKSNGEPTSATSAGISQTTAPPTVTSTVGIPNTPTRPSHSHVELTIAESTARPHLHLRQTAATPLQPPRSRLPKSRSLPQHLWRLFPRRLRLHLQRRNPRTGRFCQVRHNHRGSRNRRQAPP